MYRSQSKRQARRLSAPAECSARVSSVYRLLWKCLIVAPSRLLPSLATVLALAHQTKEVKRSTVIRFHLQDRLDPLLRQVQPSKLVVIVCFVKWPGAGDGAMTGSGTWFWGRAPEKSEGQKQGAQDSQRFRSHIHTMPRKRACAERP
jgi:hypothetical protein